MAILAAAVGVVVILLNLGAAALACSTENSHCSGSPRLWRGRVYGQNRAPARAATVLYTFASNQPRGTPLGREVRIHTDSAGRYCLRWPSEKVTAALYVVDVVAGETPDPRLEGQADTRGPIIVTPDAAGGLVAGPGTPGGRRLYVPVISGPWNPATDATNQCTQRSPPWYRRDGLIVNWRSLLLFALGAGAVGLGVRSLSVGGGARFVFSSAAAGVGVLAAILFVLIWVSKSI